MSIAERLADAAGQAFLTPATVASVTRLSARFVQVELRAEAFRKASFTPGAKIRVRPRAGTVKLRTYTPAAWADDTATLVASTHGSGPASEFFASAAEGDVLPFAGPGRSTDLASLGSRVIFAGDDTSVGLACALGTLDREVAHLFEGSPELPGVLAGLGVHAAVVERPEILVQARALAGDTPYDLVVTGDATLVHTIRRAVRDWPNPPRRLLGKAYWAEGRAGLD